MPLEEQHMSLLFPESKTVLRYSLEERDRQMPTICKQPFLVITILSWLWHKPPHSYWLP